MEELPKTFKRELDKIELDRDLPDSIWNRYLKVKYKDTYRFKKMEDGMWGIKCKYGTIQPYSLKNNYLLFEADFLSRNKKTYFMKKLPNYVQITQDGEEEVVFKFKEEYLPSLETVLEIRKKRKFSEKQLILLHERIGKYQFKKKVVGDKQ